MPVEKKLLENRRGRKQTETDERKAERVRKDRRLKATKAEAFERNRGRVHSGECRRLNYLNWRLQPTLNCYNSHR